MESKARGAHVSATDRNAYWSMSKDTARAASGAASHVLYTPSWQPCALPPEEADQDVTWILLCASGSTLNALSDHLCSTGTSVITVWPGGLATLGHDSETALLQQPELAGKRLRVVLSSAYFAAPQSTDSYDMAKVCHQAANTLTAIAGEHRLSGVWLVAENAQAVTDQDQDIHPQAAALWGLLKTALSEFPGRFGGLVEVSAARQERDAAVAALPRLFRSPPYGHVLAVRGGEFYRERLEAITVSEHAPAANSRQGAQPEAPQADTVSLSVEQASRRRFQPRANAAYLITGAFGSVGFILARHLLEGDAGGVVLQARRPPSSDQLRQIESWRAQGARISVLIDSLSATDAEARLLASLTAIGLPLGGIFHLAATRADGPIGVLDQESWAAPFIAKQDALPLLRRVAHEAQVDALVYFCSLASLLGLPGQGNRVAANAVLEALAREDRRAGVPATCILWGPWSEASPEASHNRQRQRRLLRRGLKLIDTRSAFAMLDAAMMTDHPVCVAAEVDWPTLASSAPHLYWLEKTAGDTRGVPAVVTRTKLQPAAFLLSAPRSGSTLLRAMLAGHSHLFAPPELHMLQFDTLRERAVALADSGLDEGLIRAYMELTGAPADVARLHIQQWVEQDLSIPQVYANLQRLAGGRLLVDKSPSYAMNVDALADIERWFEGARYIHLTRDPHGMIESYQRMRMFRMFGDGTDTAQSSGEFVWSTCNRNLLKLQAAIPESRWFTLSYEHLVQAPHSVMRELCDFLGIPFEHSVLTPHAPRRMTDGLKAGVTRVGDPNFSRRHGIVAALAEVDPSWRVNHPLGPATQTVAGKLGYTKALTQSIPWMSGCRESVVEIGARRMPLCQWGSPAGAPVLILHDWQDQAATWAALARNLVDGGYRVFAPDLRQHGRDRDFLSHRPSTFDFLGDAHAFMQLQRLNNVHVVGHGFGAVIAALLAAANPGQILSLTWVEPLLPEKSQPLEGNGLRRRLNELAKPPQMIRHDSLQAVARRLQYTYPSLTAEALQVLAARIAEPDGGGYVCPTLERGSVRLTAAMRDIDAGWFVALIRKLDLPVMWLHGTRGAQQNEHDVSEMRSALSGLQLRDIEGGHHLQTDAPNVMGAVLAEFFRQSMRAADTTATAT